MPKYRLPFFTSILKGVKSQEPGISARKDPIPFTSLKNKLYFPPLSLLPTNNNGGPYYVPRARRIRPAIHWCFLGQITHIQHLKSTIYKHVQPSSLSFWGGSSAAASDHGAAADYYQRPKLISLDESNVSWPPSAVLPTPENMFRLIVKDFDGIQYIPIDFRLNSKYDDQVASNSATKYSSEARAAAHIEQELGQKFIVGHTFACLYAEADWFFDGRKGLRITKKEIFKVLPFTLDEVLDANKRLEKSRKIGDDNDTDSSCEQCGRTLKVGQGYMCQKCQICVQCCDVSTSGGFHGGLNSLLSMGKVITFPRSARCRWKKITGGTAN